MRVEIFVRMLDSGNEAFGQRHKFPLPPIGLPNHAAVGPQSNNIARNRASQGFYAIAWFEVHASAETLDDLYHDLTIQYPRDIVGDGGGNFTKASSRQVCK